ncbi:MAG: flagellar motor protein MotB [Silvanigrellales bacterium]|jgi:chemotaxis protein MotB|nr:flagellar motor protein MotB [Silvanigrellales bacterium]
MRRRKGTSEEGWLLSYADLITNLLIFFVMILSASSISTVKLQKMSQSLSGKTSSTSLDQIKKRVDEKIREDKLEGMVSTRLTDEGLELSLNSGIVFDIGSAVVRSEWDPVLAKLLGRVAQSVDRYKLAVEGHTDSLPMTSTRFPSNWELSSARAMEVRQRLEGVGIEDNRIRVEAYADTKPPPAEETKGLSPEEVNSRMRRVVVRIF